LFLFFKEKEDIMEKQCPRLAKCPMFARLSLQCGKDALYVLYCKGDFTRCTRKQKAEKGEEVPGNMLPNGELLDF